MTGSTRFARHRVAYWLAWVIVVVVLGGCSSSRLEVDSEQGRLDKAAPVIEGPTTVGQTFVAHRDRLAAVEVLLVVYGDTGAPDGELTFHLRTDPASHTDLATRTFRTGKLTHNQPLRVNFHPLPDSRDQSYYFFFDGSAGSQVTVWYNTIDAYADGRVVFEGQMQAGDLQFKTFYDYSPGMVAGDVVRGVARHGWLTLPLMAMLLLPGYLALLLAVPAGDLPDPVLQVALAVGLSVAVLPLVLLFTTVVGLSLTPALFGGLLALVAVAVVWRLWRQDWQPLAAWRDRSTWPVLGAFLVLLAITLALRMLQVRELVVPAWVDGLHHTVMTQLIAEQGRVPADYQPYLDIGPFIYHFGFHVLAAGLSWLTGLAVPQAVLVMGQVVNALVGVGVYALTVTLMEGESWAVGDDALSEAGPEPGRGVEGLSKHRWSAAIAGLVAMGAVGTMSLMPAYYVTWGRYTQLTGLAVLPAAVALTVWWLNEGKRWALVLGALAVAGLGLVHYRVLVFYAAFVAAFLVYEVASRVFGVMSRSRPDSRVSNFGTRTSRQIWETVSDYCVRVVMLAGLSLLLLSPWLLRLWVVLVPTGRGGGWLNGPAAFNAVPRALIDVGYDRILLRLALFSLLAGLIWWRRMSIVVGLWVAAAILAANPNLLGRQETWLLSNAVLVITLFLPMCVLVGALTGMAADAVLTRVAGRLRPAIAAALAGVFFVGVLAGAWNMLDIVNPVTVVATKDDITVMDWIRQNTQPDDGFVTNVRVWQYGTYMGADGGYWISLLTGRRTLVPPAIYSFGARQAYSRVQGILDVLAGISEAQDRRLMDLMRQHNLKYVYLGAKGGPLDLESFLDDPVYEAVYSNGPVWIFRIRQAEAGVSK